MVKRLGTILGTVLVGAAGTAHAQVDNAGVLDQALKQYRTAAEAWQSAGQSAASTLFWSLATISLVWTMGQLVLRRAELGEFFGELVRYLLFTGFWAWMLNSGPAHAHLIIESMIKLAGGASGQNMMSPSGVLDVGFHLVDRALTQSSILSPLDSAIGIVLALVILVVLALVGVNMLVTLIACWIVAYGGLIVLGFGGSRWTSDMAINYYRMVLSLGLQIMAMVLLVGIGESFLRSYFAALEKNVSLHQQAVLLVVSIVLLATVNRVPGLLGTLANGSSPQYALGGGPGAGAAMTALSTVGGLAALSMSGAAQAATDGAGKLALGSGPLANAMAAATPGEGSSAMASLLDGFRSRGTDSGAGGASGGGSVLPAPAASAGVRAAASTPAVPPASHSMQRTDTGSAAARAATPRSTEQSELPAKATDGPQAKPPSASVASREAAADSRSGSRTRGGRAPSAPRPQHASGSTPHDAVALPTAPRAQHASGAAANAKTRGMPGGAPEGGSSDGSKPGPRPERYEAESRHVASTPASYPSSPAGTFTQAPGVAPIAAGVPGAHPTGPLASTTAPAPRATAPMSALAGAVRAALSPADIAFSVPTGDPLKPSATPAAAPSVEISDRAELPAAYSQQVSVDVEAEVAAFRDRD